MSGETILYQGIRWCRTRGLRSVTTTEGDAWDIRAELRDDVTLYIAGYADSITTDSVLVTAWDREYGLGVDEAVALLSGQIDARRWLDDMEEAARLLAGAQEYAEQLDAERSA